MNRQLLTKKELEFWHKIIKYYLDHLVPPKKNELARYLNTSPQAVQYYFNSLQKKGWIDKTIKLPRT